MLNIKSYFIAFLLVFLSTEVLSLQTMWSNGVESQVRIISSLSNNNNQNQINLGLEYKLKDGWKTYWKSAGEGGFPQEIDWKSSTNIKDLQILWPTPQIFEIQGFYSIGYTDEVIFPLKITIDDIKKETTALLKVSYVTCKDICVPGEATIELKIPPGYGEVTEHSHSIEKALSLIPEKNLNVVDIEEFAIKSFEQNDQISILIEVQSKNRFINPKFYLDTEFGLPVSKSEIKYTDYQKKISARFIFDKKIITKDSFNLDVVVNDQDKSFEISDKVHVEKLSKSFIQNNSLLYFFLISLVAGLILNIMPCVLPVLSIKLLSILNNSREKTSIRFSFFVTSLGIVVSFALLSIMLIILKYFGVSIGWGMQFQQPIFLVIIAIILFLFSINLFGFFEFNFAKLLNLKILHTSFNSKYLQDFFNGFFATILATPCSAPFVGTAITVAFTQSAFAMFGIFIFMGLGMSLPYLLISAFPSLTNFIPKPGNWIKYVKYFLGVLLLGTFFWILSILINNHYSYFSNYKNNENGWLNFSSVKIEDYIENNNIVFIDITADWCATCQFNKINVINSSTIEEAFKNYNVVKIRGDWTKSNNKIEQFLSEYNRFGIPFNIMYSKLYPDGIILSELLTKKEIISALKKMEPKK